MLAKYHVEKSRIVYGNLWAEMKGCTEVMGDEAVEHRASDPSVSTQKAYLATHMCPQGIREAPSGFPLRNPLKTSPCENKN